MSTPDLSLEWSLLDAGARWVVAFDEVGRGTWAGPVGVGAVAVSIDQLWRPVPGVDDSKRLTARRREALVEAVVDWAPSAVAYASAAEIDAGGMTAALGLAAHRCLDELARHGVVPDAVIVDGNHNWVRAGVATTTVVKGDQVSVSVAAASVIAKVDRDALMAAAAREWDAYGFDRNAGYHSPAHVAGLDQVGLCPLHRRSWRSATPYLRRAS